MQDVASSFLPVLQLDGLTVPSSGEVARAGQVRTLAQRMLDNDAALAAMIAGAGAPLLIEQTVNAQAPDGATFFSGVPVPVAVPLGSRVGMLALVRLGSGFGGRVRLYHDQYSAEQDGPRGLYTPPSQYEVIGDVGTGQYGNDVGFDRPILAHTNGNGFAVTLYASFMPWADVHAAQVAVNLTYAILALDNRPAPQAD